MSAEMQARCNALRWYLDAVEREDDMSKIVGVDTAIPSSVPPSQQVSPKMWAVFGVGTAGLIAFAIYMMVKK